MCQKERFLIFWLVWDFLLLLFCLIQEFFEESCLFFILIWLLSNCLTYLKNYFHIQLISSFFGPKRVIFDFWLVWKIFVVALSYTRIFWRKFCLFFILIWLLSDFLTCLKNYFHIQLISSFFDQKKRYFWFFDLYEIFVVSFLSYTRIFWRKLSIFHFNLIIIWFSYMFKELFPYSANFIIFWAEKSFFWFFDLYEIFCCCFFVLYKNFLKKVVYF